MATRRLSDTDAKTDAILAASAELDAKAEALIAQARAILAQLKGLSL